MTKIITFEGIDGTGKGTQMELLSSYLEEQGWRVGKIGFPVYESFFGTQVGSYLSAQNGIAANTVDSKSMALWFALDRFKTFSTIDVNDYDVFLINRYVLSNAVYQSIREIDLEHPVADFFSFVQELEFVQLGIPRPTLELIFDMDLELAAHNVEKKGYRDYIGNGKDVYESIPGIQLRSRSRYLEYAAKLDNAVLINCMDGNRLMDVDSIQNIVRKIVQEHLIEE